MKKRTLSLVLALAMCLGLAVPALAAEELGEYGMTPSDLIEQIPYAIKELI